MKFSEYISSKFDIDIDTVHKILLEHEHYIKTKMREHLRYKGYVKWFEYMHSMGVDEK